mgnify:CR=1 FL=1
MKDTTEINKKRALRGFPPIESVWDEMRPSCKMRLLGPDNLRAFTRKFVINRINIEDSCITQ